MKELAFKSWMVLVTNDAWAIVLGHGCNTWISDVNFEVFVFACVSFIPVSTFAFILLV